MITLDTLELPDELIWIDEFEWSDVKANTKRTIQGKFIVQELALISQSGRNVTLTSDDSWIERSDLLTLQDWSNTLGKEMTLTMNDGRVFFCRFRHWDTPVLASDMIRPTAFPEAGTNYRLNIKLVVL